MSVLAQALCDCEITRIVMTAENIPINLGRTKRTYTGTHRRAIIARDHHCAWNGCQSPARWAEIHHIRWWNRDNGDTSLHNGILLCTYHHGIVHTLNLTIERHTTPPPNPAPTMDTTTTREPTRYTFWTHDHHPHNHPPRQ